MPNPETPASARWYALQVRHRCEKAVASILDNKGYRGFLPLYSARRRWSDRTAEVQLPLFPGYIFVHFDPHDRRVPIVTTPFVLQLVGIGREPAPVDDAEIAALRKVVASNAIAEPWPYLNAGQSVRIAAGPLAGVEGILVDVKNRRRLVLSVTLLQRSVRVDIDGVSVTPLGPWRTAIMGALAASPPVASR